MLSAAAPEHPPQLLPAPRAQDSSLHPAGPALRDLTPSSETPHLWPVCLRRGTQPPPVWSQLQPQVPVPPRQKKPAAQQPSSVPPSGSVPLATATAPSPSEVQACLHAATPAQGSALPTGPIPTGGVCPRPWWSGGKERACPEGRGSWAWVSTPTHTPTRLGRSYSSSKGRILHHNELLPVAWGQMPGCPLQGQGPPPPPSRFRPHGGCRRLCRKVMLL